MIPSQLGPQVLLGPWRFGNFWLAITGPQLTIFPTTHDTSVAHKASAFPWEESHGLTVCCPFSELSILCILVSLDHRPNQYMWVLTRYELLSWLDGHIR
jgi:hypothetical protein